MSTEAERVSAPEYPTEIVTEPFTLDGVEFIPHPHATTRIENAYRGAVRVGDVLHDDNRFWFARKFDAHGELSDWKPMRSAAEARAFIVSNIRQ